MEKPLYRCVERQARRMHEMMDRVGVDPVRLVNRDGAVSYTAARRRCLSCGTTDLCLRWLDGPKRTGTRPQFCPNLKLFEGCKRPPQ